MRLQDLAVRLVAVEAKLATLTGTSVNTDNATSIEELDARLSVVEAHIDHMMTTKTESHIDAIVYSPADEAPVAVEEVLAFSPSFGIPEAAAIVTDVVAELHEANAIINPEVADMVTAAVVAVVTAEPQIVLDPVAMTAAIVEAIADMPAPSPEAVAEVVAAVVEVVATATGVDTIAIEVQQQIADAVATPADPTLDAIEARLNAVDSKLDSLLGN